MDFAGAIQVGLKKYADFRGRATRAEYWWFYLFTFLVSLMGGAIDIAIHQTSTGPVQSLISLALALPQISLTVRRNRDAGFSAWWMLLWVIPVGLAVIGVVGNWQALSGLSQIYPAVISNAEVVQIGMLLLQTFGASLVAFIAVGLFFFVLTLLPSKAPKRQPVVATTDY